MTLTVFIFVGISLPVVFVNGAETDYSPFSGMAIADLGTQLLVTFSNVTYTLDGTGNDLGPLKLDTTLHSIENLRFVILATSESSGQVSNDGDALVVDGSHFKVFTTNQTVDDSIQFDVRKIEDLGSIDFGEAIGDNTDYNTTVPENAAVAINVTADYVELNKSLTKLAEDFSTKDNYFDGRTNRHPRGEYQTIVVGYDDTEAGILGDLKLVLAKLLERDADDFRIQDYNLTSAYISFNMSNAMTTWMKEIVDTAIDRANADLTVDQNAKLAFPGTNYRFIDSLGETLAGISTGVNSMAISFGVPLSGYSKPSTFRQITLKNAEAYFNPAGAAIKASLAEDPDANVPVLDISDQVGTGVKKITNDPVAIHLTALTGISANITQYWWILPVIFGVLAIIYFVRRRRMGKKTFIWF